jgi:hypothetical protein
MTTPRNLICSTCAGSGRRSRIGPAHSPDQRFCGDCKGRGVFVLAQPTGIPMTTAAAWEAMRPVQPLLEIDWTKQSEMAPPKRSKRVV